MSNVSPPCSFFAISRPLPCLDEAMGIPEDGDAVSSRGHSVVELIEEQPG